MLFSALVCSQVWWGLDDPMIRWQSQQQQQQGARGRGSVWWIDVDVEMILTNSGGRRRIMHQGHNVIIACAPGSGFAHRVAKG